MGRPRKDIDQRSKSHELIKEIEELRNINLKNTEAHITINVENAKLKKTIESLKGEFDDLKEEEEKTVELKFQNRKLNEKIDSQWTVMYDLEEDKDKAVYELKNIL